MIASIVVALAISAAPEASYTQQPTASHLSAIDMFDLADRARADGRVDDAITLYDALTHDQNNDVRAEARFRKGMMLADLKRYREAALVFRRLLDEQPGAARVRLELARVLALLGDERAARRELRQAEATGLPAEVALTVGQFDQALRSRKRMGGSIELGFAPDSNVNRATQARVLDTIIAPLTLSSDAREQSGVGLHLAGQGYAKIDMGSHLSLVPRVSGLATVYHKREFTDVSGSALIGIQWQRTRDRFTPSIGETRRWYGGKRYAQTDAISIDWLHVLGRRSELVVSGSASHADYQRNDLQDGHIYALSTSVERALTARAGVTLTARAERQTARDPGYATASGGLSLLGWRETGRMTLFGAAAVQRTEGDAALFLFGKRRREWFVSGRVGATFRQLTIHGLAPYVRLNLERNRSSVGLYDYRRAAAEIGVTRAF